MSRCATSAGPSARVPPRGTLPRTPPSRRGSSRQRWNRRQERGEGGVVPDGAIRVSAPHRRVPLPTPHAFRGSPMRHLRLVLAACALAASGSPSPWSTAAPIPEPIQETHAAVLHGRIYIAGGI